MSISERWRQSMGRANAEVTADGFIATGSRLVALWLRHVGGYRVDSVRKTPRAGAFGGIHYQNVWVLCPRGDAVNRRKD